MALKIYESADPDTSYSTGDSFTNPMSFSLDGALGGVIVQRFYLRNDDDTKYYTNIELTPIVEGGLNIVDDDDSGFSWKLKEGDTQPLEAEWFLISGGNTISFSDLGEVGIGDMAIYLPFWLRIEIPTSVEVQSFDGVKLQIVADEEIV